MARFRARARTVDMLGRQQIAGIPTAISELFKNAHDAYADHVEVDFYRSDGLFVLRDDGMGMSREDFEGRWLTLGTESKVGVATGLHPPPTDSKKPKRTLLGEKGIGRLAIAAIGPQLLILTRAKTPSGRADVVAAFVHWGLFGLPGVDLDAIEVPMTTFRNGKLPDATAVREMVDLVRQNFDAISKHLPSKFRADITGQLRRFNADPQALDAILGTPSLTGDGHGTHFLIQPADESLIPAIDGAAGEDIAPPLLKTLIGFANTMTPDFRSPLIATAFRDHKTEELTDELIGQSAFFTPDEFRNADHHIEGEFDDFGQFNGTVTVYGEPKAKHVVPWQSARGQAVECGPFKINLAVVQGVATQSTLPNDDWVQMIRKLNRIGGLYIYREGIRVLPYGNNDYDFLDIERNRTKSASDWYFSYRRIFGVIEIDQEHNKNLSEKAGREGFRENKAYRQFREILKNFFAQIAVDFFRDGGTHADRYHTKRTEIDRLEKAKKAREKQVSAKRTSFRAQLQKILAEFNDNAPAQQAAAVIGELTKNLSVAAAEKDRDRAAIGFIDAEVSARRALTVAKEHFRVVAPRGVGLAKAVRRDFESYRDQYDRIVPPLFAETQARIETLLSNAIRRAQIAVDRRIRFERALSDLTTEARRAVQAQTQQAQTVAEDLHVRVAALTRESLAELDVVVKDVLSQAARLDITHLEDDRFVKARTKLEDDVQRVADAQQRFLGGVTEQLKNVVWSRDDESSDSTSTIDIAEALEEETIELRERSEADLELAQLGMAIQVINHEFDHTIKAIRSNIRELHAWADANDSLRALYQNIRRSFDHLDGYLTLFTPLQRRLYRVKVVFSGSEIFKFLCELFQERLERLKASLEATTAFKRHSITGYPSSFYPVFVNVVDNALYWLDRSPGPRRIRLDLCGDGMLIMNSGPPIPEHDREAVFEQGFTRKPGGRGLGLHIVRQVLGREGLMIHVVEPPEGMGTAFLIEATKDMKGKR